MESNRGEFLRRTGTLGIAGASFLGYPLAETPIAGARPLPPPRDVIAAGGGATIRLGHLDGFTGTYSDAAAAQHVGAQLAVARAMGRNSRIKIELVKGDDGSAIPAGQKEARRLIVDEKVDALFGVVASSVTLAVSDVAQELGCLFLATGAPDSSITGNKAHKVTFR